MGDELTTEMTDKVCRFIDEYMVDSNATQAAIRAGYSAKTAAQIGYQLLQKTSVSAEIERRRTDLAGKLGITAEKVLAEWAAVGFSNIADFVEFGQGGGVRIKDLTGLRRELQCCVAEVQETTTKEGGSLKFKLHDKLKALDALTKHLGLYAPEKIDARVQPIRERTPEEREANRKLLQGDDDGDT